MASLHPLPRCLCVRASAATLFSALLLTLLATQVGAAELVRVPIDARIGTEARGRERGEQAARADIAAGQLKLYESTGPEPAQDLPRQALRKRWLQARGIRLELGAGCTDSAEQRGFYEAYNSAMTAEVQRRFGPAFWSNLDQVRDQRLPATPRRGHAASAPR